MKNQTNQFLEAGGLQACDFRLHALDLNRDLANVANGTAEELSSQQTQPETSWLLTDPNYVSAIQDLVLTVRETQRLTNTLDSRSDAVLSADILKAMGLWNHPQPTGQWGNARFMVRFLTAFTRFYFPAKAEEGRQQRQFNKCLKASSQ